MRRVWSEIELNEHWVLNDEELYLLKGHTAVGRLALSVQLKHYQIYACFPDGAQETDKVVLAFLSAQINANPDTLDSYDFDSRTGRQHRREILSHLNIQSFDESAEKLFRQWLIDTIFADVPTPPYLNELVTEWFLKYQFEQPGSYRLKRIIQSAEYDFEQQLFQTIYNRLNQSICSRLDDILTEKTTNSGKTGFAHLCSDTGPIGLESVMQTIDRINVLRTLDIPSDILQKINPKLIKRYHQRAATENAWEIRRHSSKIRYSLLVFYCVLREGELIDSLVDLLIQINHQISARAERKVIKELVNNITKVHSKTNILFRIAEAVLKEPDGSVRDVVFPVASEQIIEQLVKEFRSSGPAYVNSIYTKIRSSYAHHYRRMLPRILDALEFRSNNTAWRSTLNAIDIIKASRDSRELYFAIDDVPVEGLVRNKWRDIVIEEAPDGTMRINRINYEICVLHALREKLRCKEIWVVDANRFCNPDDDMPADFETNKENYYAVLGCPIDPEVFVKQIKKKMEEALSKFNQNIPHDPKVHIKHSGKKAALSVASLTAQTDPPNLDALKKELSYRWPETGLLDVLKETNFRVGFTNSFSTSASRETNNPDEISRRLLLTLYALGTNAGLKKLASGRQGVSYKELLHIRRRYINKENLRDAIRRVVNATFEARLPEIWGGSNDVLCIRFNQIWSMGSKPHDRMACTLWR